ncbi:MAG: SDR family oxidoreductase [Deltaproteobacteria bacterium]|nr:SDR family oxidoreductase [Deltaproteobacteria bacterium]
MSNTKILVLGATGTIGTHVVNELVSRGVTVRAAARNATSLTARSGVEPCGLVLGDDASVKRALDGVSAAFLLTPFDPDQVALGTHFVDRAKAAGVKRVVKLSAFGSDIEPGIQLGRWHRAIEKHLEASGLEHTILRPNNFMQNFLGYYPPDAEGVIYLPWGDAGCSFIDGRDVAQVAALALTEPGHAGKAYTLTGPSAFGIGEAAKTLSEVSGRKISYVDVPEATTREAMAKAGAPAWMADAMMELHAIDKAGYATAVTDDFTRITGSAPRTFRDFARDHASAWKR